jgi:hypothetical protein
MLLLWCIRNKTMTTIEEIKQQLQCIIELDAVAETSISKRAMLTSEAKAIAPAAARALLAAIEVLWAMSMEGDYHESVIADNAIENIQLEWDNQQK